MKENKVIYLLSSMILGAQALTHFTGQMNLLAPAWVWGVAFVCFTAFQATYTRFFRTGKILGGSKTSSVGSNG